MGGILVGVGLYAFFEKWKGTGYSLVLNAEQMILDISIIMLIVGFVMFTVSFAGCVGALRENSCLLKFVSYISQMVVCEKLYLTETLDCSIPLACCSSS